jgi:hypothetical protein
MTFRPCCVIPSRNHFENVGDVTRQVRAAGLPIFLIDDASAEPARSVLSRLNAPERDVTVLRLDDRRGKGGAVVHGLQRAHALGFSHAVQVDADGQHDLGTLGELLRTAERQPEAMVCGAAQYDASVPAGRRWGRYLTHFWICIETLSLQIRDGLCGFRVYPLEATMAVLAAEPVGRFMDFDPEILVRLAWRNVPIIMVPVRVTYQPNMLSNFELLHDNVRITRMHVRLVLNMLWRLPRILGSRIRRADG